MDVAPRQSVFRVVRVEGRSDVGQNVVLVEETPHAIFAGVLVEEPEHQGEQAGALLLLMVEAVGAAQSELDDFVGRSELGDDVVSSVSLAGACGCDVIGLLLSDVRARCRASMAAEMTFDRIWGESVTEPEL